MYMARTFKNAGVELYYIVYWIIIIIIFLEKPTYQLGLGANNHRIVTMDSDGLST